VGCRRQRKIQSPRCRPRNLVLANPAPPSIQLNKFSTNLRRFWLAANCGCSCSLASRQLGQFFDSPPAGLSGSTAAHPVHAMQQRRQILPSNVRHGARPGDFSLRREVVSEKRHAKGSIGALVGFFQAVGIVNVSRDDFGPSLGQFFPFPSLACRGPAPRSRACNFDVSGVISKPALYSWGGSAWLPFSELTFRVSARTAKPPVGSLRIARTKPLPCAPVAPIIAIIFFWHADRPSCARNLRSAPRSVHNNCGYSVRHLRVVTRGNKKRRFLLLLSIQLFVQALSGFNIPAGWAS